MMFSMPLINSTYYLLGTVYDVFNLLVRKWESEAGERIRSKPSLSHFRIRALSTTMTRIAIVYYSLYGHVGKLAEAVKVGAKRVPGVDAQLYQVAETLPSDILQKMGAPPKPDLPVATPDVLKNSDGVLFGIPTRFGMLPSQVKGLFDACGGLWATGGLVGKPAGFFFSTGSIGGGQETTALTSMPFLAHHGMMYVPLGYRTPLLASNDQVHGGSPWGTGTIANGDGSRQPSELELEIAKVQGESFAAIAKKLVQ
jgi:NAD(P)H dehydrogenase (quinone)